MDYNEKQNAGNASTSGMKTEEYVAENSDAILERVKQCDTPFAETFTKVFGSCPEKKYRRLSIVSEISKIYKDIHFQFYGPLKLKRSKCASNSQFCVKYFSSTWNVISYTINDEPLDICLRGKTHLVEATNVLSVIENLQEALASEDQTTILSIFEEVGYLNALDIIRICYPKLAICFFTRIAERMVRTRQRVHPFLLLKNYIKTVPYQGNARQFFYTLLEQLENNVPYYEEQLIAGNEQEHLTMIHYLSYMFRPNQSDTPKSNYVKWYSAEQINAIADALPLVYRCIFLDTVYVGHRVGGVLSFTMDSVDLYNGTVTPTKSKTGKIHTSYIPATLIEDMRQYLIDVRGNIKTNSNAFFIGRNGSPVTYQAYRAALESARITVNKKYGWNIEALHTHAGRSTFAAALRTYQLDCRRNGVLIFSDVDFCNLMDWKSLDSLKHYDLINRIHEISPLIKELYSDFDSIVEKNGNLISTEVESV